MDINEFRSLRHTTGFPKGKNEIDDFKLFKKHDKPWSDYFLKIFLENYNPGREITFVFWESGPGPEKNQPALIEPKETYAFSNLETKLDNSKYLKRVCIIAGILNNEVRDENDHFYTGGQNSKAYALKLLSKKNWLIIDLYPTHGKKIKNRNTLVYGKNNIFTNYTKKHLESIFLTLHIDLENRFTNNTRPMTRFNYKVYYLDFLIDTIGKIIYEKSWFEEITNLTMKKIQWESYS